MADREVIEHVGPDPELADSEIEFVRQSRAPYRPANGKRRPLLEWFIVLAKKKSIIVKVVGAAALCAVVIVLLLPSIYTGTAGVIPSRHSLSLPTEFVSQMSSQISNSGDVYVAMLQSETVANRLIDRFDLMKAYGAGLRTDARKILADRTEINLGKDGVISIAVEDRSPQRAADLANGYVEELEGVGKDIALGKGRKQEKFLEGQVKAASDALANAENALRTTKEKTGLVLFDPQTETLINAAAAMRARVAAQEVRLQWMRTFAAPGNPELERETQQLAALRDQETRLESGNRQGMNVPLENVPGASLEYARSLRETKFREALLGQLEQQLEEAKLDEARTSLMVQPLVQMLDRAAPPEQRSGPHRVLIVLTITLLAMLLAALAVSAMEKIERARRIRKPPARVPLYAYQMQERPENLRRSG